MRKKIVAGVSLGTSSSHTRYGDRDDVVVISLEAGSKVSCKFTSNRFKEKPAISRLFSLYNYNT